MSDHTGTMILAVYPDRGLAEEDLELLHDDRSGDRPFDVVDATLVFEDDKGRVRTSKRPRRSRRRGGRANPRVSLLHRRHGLRYHDLVAVRDRLERSDVALVAVTRGAGVEDIVPELHATELHVNRLRPADREFQQLLMRRSQLS